MNKINVAIDGTSGVGKSSVADQLAERFNMIHLDTGAMYRCIALALKKAAAALDDEAAIQKVLDESEISFDPQKNVYLNGENVSKAIRTDEISALTSRVSQIPKIRQNMVALQQKIAASQGYIVDGRDICSVVLPDAQVKIFMSAAPEARATRRMLQNRQLGLDDDYETILKDIIARDQQDMNRAISPLIKAEDAIEVDTSHLTKEEVTEQIAGYIQKAMKEGDPA